MRTSKRTQIDGAAPGLHDLDAERTERRNRRLAWLVPLALVASGFVHEVTPDEKPAKDDTEEVTTISPIQELIANGAEVRNQAIILRPGVRLRPQPLLTEVHMGHDTEGNEVPQLTEQIAVLKPAVVKNDLDQRFFAVELGADGTVAYISTDVIDMPNDYNKDIPYGQEIDLAEESYADTQPSTIVNIEGGEPGISGYLTTLDVAEA